MLSVAGMVAEAKIAGYPTGYVEVDVAGRTPVVWDAVRVARIEAGLPVRGHKDCEIPFDVERIATDPDSANPDSVEHITGCITEEDVAAVNWPTTGVLDRGARHGVRAGGSAQRSSDVSW
jgi:hypothetical protein